MKRTFYILFICLAVLAKILLVTVIVFTIVMSCCPPSCSGPGESPRGGGGGRVWHEDKRADRVFNARICAIK